MNLDKELEKALAENLDSIVMVGSAIAMACSLFVFVAGVMVVPRTIYYQFRYSQYKQDLKEYRECALAAKGDMDISVYCSEPPTEPR